MDRRQFVNGGIFAVWGALAPGHALARDKLKVAIGGRGGWDSSIIELAQVGGFFDKNGLDVEILYTQGTGESLQAVIAGGVDIGHALGTFGVLGAFAKGAPLRVIGSSMTGANDQFWYSRGGSAVRTGKDMEGRTVSYSTAGASTNAVVLGFSKTFGVKFDAVATGGLPATLTQVMSGQVDVGWSVVPFGMRELEEGKIQVVAYASEVPELRNQSVRLVTTTAGILTGKKDELGRFMAAYRQTIDWMYASDTSVEAYAKIAEVPLKYAQEVREKFISRKDVNPDRVEGLDLLMQDAIGFKFIRERLTPAQIVELVKVPLG